MLAALAVVVQLRLIAQAFDVVEGFPKFGHHRVVGVDGLLPLAGHLLHHAIGHIDGLLVEQPQALRPQALHQRHQLAVALGDAQHLDIRVVGQAVGVVAGALGDGGQQRGFPLGHGQGELAHVL